MSHFTRLRTRIVSLRHLKAALTAMGLSWQEGNVNIRGFGGQTTPVELKVPTRNPGYDIGFQRRGDSYDLVADWWGIRDINRDEFLAQLQRRYAYEVARDQLEAQGFSIVEETVEQDETVHLFVRRMV